MTLKQARLARNDMVEYATLDVSLEELESQGLVLEEAWIDGLGLYKGAGVVLRSGAELAFATFTDTPENGILVWAPLAIEGPAIAHELADELGVPRNRITWIREQGIDGSPSGSPADTAEPA